MRLMKIKTMAALIGFLSACASNPVFPYRFYYLDLDRHAMLGAQESDDISLDYCGSIKPEHACVVMKKDDFENLYQNNLESQ